MIDLKDYICSVPFVNMEIHEHTNYMCCPSWLLKELPKSNMAEIKDYWNSDEAQEIRKSVMDGSYRHCSKDQCPYLAQLLTLGATGTLGPLVHKSELKHYPYIEKYVKRQDGYMEDGPKIIQFSFDRTCNYKCPSCRLNVVTADSKKIQKVEATIEEIENAYSNSLTDIYITGTGDPFVSVAFRNFLRNFNASKYPNIKKIHLHTNASMWTKEMWESMPNIHPFVKTCEISIDAGTKETYENITRLGGNWDTLIRNLKFINTIPKLEYIKTSFVVQSSNYKEMKTFVDTMKGIFGRKVHIFFGKINNWGTFSEGEFKLIKVWDDTHPEHLEFKKELEKVWKDPQVFHNMHEFINTEKKLL